MTLVDCQQPTCLCVRMEFVVGIISFSSELYSVSWSCFRTPGSVTIVHAKWCLDLHVECCGSCMVSTIGVGAGKLLGVRKIFARIFSNLPEKVWATLPTNFFPQRSWRSFFGMTSKKVLHVFFCKRWAPFYEIKQGWAPFLPGFSEILPRFLRTFPGFSINQNF